MLHLLKQMWRNEDGQDLIEYTLLLAFVALVAAGIFIQAGQSVSGIWSAASTVLVNANGAAAKAAS
jgi:Flp pilus assembly pilin Flp